MDFSLRLLPIHAYCMQSNLFGIQHFPNLLMQSTLEKPQLKKPWIEITDDFVKAVFEKKPRAKSLLLVWPPERDDHHRINYSKNDDLIERRRIKMRDICQSDHTWLIKDSSSPPRVPLHHRFPILMGSMHQKIWSISPYQITQFIQFFHGGSTKSDCIKCQI